ncbi:hypothetical protein BN12_550022 [Nostocoides japonicum T1-X7]|uniref:Uncharacterized protein n=1 Tax=Nostocoides japonicum T1-X7 TaxID=1194083 RepID=A0A077M6F7_9MICO|nr:hypothetical protein BN12_550022 [Tetrasphaera japonica T1-X7]
MSRCRRTAVGVRPRSEARTAVVTGPCSLMVRSTRSRVRDSWLSAGSGPVVAGSAGLRTGISTHRC